MTVLHKTSLAIRRISSGNNITKRMYSHLTQPLYRTSTNGSAASSEAKNTGWVVPAAIALFGLGFSTFSTHQLMSCSGDNMAIGKK